MDTAFDTIKTDNPARDDNKTLIEQATDEAKVLRDAAVQMSIAATEAMEKIAHEQIPTNQDGSTKNYLHAGSATLAAKITLAAILDANRSFLSDEAAEQLDQITNQMVGIN